MTILKIAGIALISASALMLVRSIKPELATPLSIAAGICILLLVLDGMDALKLLTETAAGRFGLSAVYLKIVLKVMGIAYAAQFASQMCKDCGEGALACKVELAGRLLILTASMPAIMNIVELIASLLGAS